MWSCPKCGTIQLVQGLLEILSRGESPEKGIQKCSSCETTYELDSLRESGLVK